jgi:hypothetical protein
MLRTLAQFELSVLHLLRLDYTFPPLETEIARQKKSYDVTASSICSGMEGIDRALLANCQMVNDGGSAEIVHAAWMRMRNWESDIRNVEKSTLTRLETMSPQTAEIVKARLTKLLRATECIQTIRVSGGVLPSEELRHEQIQSLVYPMNDS